MGLEKRGCAKGQGWRVCLEEERGVRGCERVWLGKSGVR